MVKPILGASTVVEVLHRRAAETPRAEALRGRRGEHWYSLSWAEVGTRARAIACGLLDLGLARGERCAILSNTRVEWVLADLGIMSAGGATTTVYPSNTAEECAFVLSDAGVVVAFVEDAGQLAKLQAQADHLPDLRHIIVFDGAWPDDGRVMDLATLAQRGERLERNHPGAYDRRTAEITGDDLATLIYTSGTTGRPKGVELTHDCWVGTAEGMDVVAQLASDDDLQFLFLPLAHSFAKALILGALFTGTPTAIDGDITRIVTNLPEVRPTFMAAVPRVFEKVYNGVVTRAKEAGARRYRIFRWAVEVGRQVSALRQRGQEPRGLLRLKHAVADRLVFTKIKQGFGGRLRIFVSGGAPLSREIAEFFHAADMLILEGYGLTESSAASFANRPDAYRFGTVGRPLPGVQVKIAEDGEVLLRGRGIMRGYHDRPEATAEVLDPDGWLHTGDIGELDADGFLRITDRKKDIIVTAGGKNIAPQVIENALKARSPFISQVVMHGDKRNFCVALITIDEEAVGKWAAEQGLSWSGYAGLAALPQVFALIQGEVDGLNATLARYETLKKFAILDHDLSTESGELTAKLSVRRRVVEARNQALLDGFYAGTVEAL
ncbi:MAG: long-chain fatty acid--CoA ligase [Alphaproteobacteria bacterium]|nr:long-chain fatty acid--CoA ligase [Alphaproteobacteria bacterium]